jgi:acyl-coenzyme A synthetase/AMP-(fatty) acid ligase
MRWAADVDKLLSYGIGLGPARAAIVEDSGVVSYADLHSEVARLAEKLRTIGFRPGHRVAIALPAGRAMLAALLATLRCGALVTILSPKLGAPLRLRRLNAFRPDLVLEEGSSLAAIEPPAASAAKADEAGHLVLWTSGSTGMPCGIVLSWQGTLWNASTNAAVLGLRSDDSALVLLDGSYCYALIHQIFSHLAVGGRVVVPPQPLWLEDVGRYIERWKPTTLALVPSMLQALLMKPRLLGPLATLRMITIGGAPIDEALLRATQSAIPGVQIVVTYGLTEAGPRVCTRFCRADESVTQGMVGLPMPGVEVRVAEDGELLVKSPSVRQGLLKDALIVPAAPWVRTGDLGAIEADGRISVRGRIKPMINRGGAKLAPGEIEEVLLSHPDVVGAHVVAIPHRRFGEAPKAFIVLASEASQFSASSALAKHCLAQLGAPWVPERFEFVAELPEQMNSWKAAK